MPARWRMPPENWCGYWTIRRSGSGMPTLSIIVTAVELLGATGWAAIEDVAHLAAIGQHRDLRGHRVLEHHRDLFAAMARRAGSDILSTSRRQKKSPRPHPRVFGQKPHNGPHHGAFARPAFADNAEDMLTRHREADIAQRLERGRAGCGNRPTSRLYPASYP